MRKILILDVSGFITSKEHPFCIQIAHRPGTEIDNEQKRKHSLRQAAGERQPLREGAKGRGDNLSQKRQEKKMPITDTTPTTTRSVLKILLAMRFSASLLLVFSSAKTGTKAAERAVSAKTSLKSQPFQLKPCSSRLSKQSL